MRCFVYVQALSTCTPDATDSFISFRHRLLRAETEADAYAQGQHWADTHSIKNVRCHNDYVIDVSRDVAQG